MIDMKITYTDEKIIIYLYHLVLNVDDDKILYQEIKKIIVQLIKNKNIDLRGFNIINLYHNKNYGCILEIDNNNLLHLPLDIIDIKLKVNKNHVFYLEFDDYIFDKEIDNILLYHNNYYLKLDMMNNWLNYLEHGKIVYNLDFH